VAATSANAGATLQLARCDADPTLSRWHFAFLAPQGLGLAESTSCLSVAPSQSSDGANLTLVACDDNSDPADFSLHGKVRFKNGFCAAVDGNVAADGASLVLRPCTNNVGLGLQFHLSARLSSNGRCAALNWIPSTTAMDPYLESRDCNAPDIPPSEFLPDPFEWDYYW
jgi:hypothetical protein